MAKKEEKIGIDLTEEDLEKLDTSKLKINKPGALYNYLYVMAEELKRLEGLTQIAYDTIAEVYPEEEEEESEVADAKEKLLALLGASHALGQLLIGQFDVVMENEYIYEDSKKETETEISKFL